MSKAREVIVTFATELIEEGTALQDTGFDVRTSSFTSDTFVESQAFQKWRTSCRLFISQLRPFADAWALVLAADKVKSNLGTVKRMLGALESIRENATRGRLAAFEDIVLAEAFSNLMDQGTHLLSKGYTLAAGVIYRAVLEERLRQMCDSSACTPEKDRATIADYNHALYKAQAYDKITMKNVDALAAVGNDAAHAKPDLASSEVSRLRDNLSDFLAKFASQ